jgi:hypothetical protein
LPVLEDARQFACDFAVYLHGEFALRFTHIIPLYPKYQVATLKFHFFSLLLEQSVSAWLVQRAHYEL